MFGQKMVLGAIVSFKHIWTSLEKADVVLFSLYFYFFIYVFFFLVLLLSLLSGFTYCGDCVCKIELEVLYAGQENPGPIARGKLET